MIIIPARLNSTRFPKKVLALINNTPMLIATANQVKHLDEVVIATDDEQILQVCKQYGFNGILTSNKHQSGTDRINQACDILNLNDDEIIINVQADEPFIEPDVVKNVIDSIKKDKQIQMLSCYKKIDETLANDENLVKVVIDKYGYAMYFSRSKIPFDRQKTDEFYGHLGIYAFRRKSLKEFCSLEFSPYEHIEKLEQLRALYNGIKIKMIEVKSSSFGIDTPQDLQMALDFFKNN